MSDIFFFTELDNVKQDEGQQFGPIDSNNYRVTSLFKAKNLDNKPKVFAIVDGTMAIQKVNGNDNLVNIYIKPSKPISSITNNQFVPIKYFVYRGVSHSSIFSKEVTVDSKKEYEIIESLVKTDSVFKRAKDIFDKLNNGKNLKLNSSIFRYNLKFNDTDFLEKLFSNVADPNITLPEVKGGEYIANFDPNSYGIEIILDTIVENPKKDIAYTLENIITVETSNVENDFKVNSKKEKILNYLDITAFYGSLVNYSKGISYANLIDINSTTRKIKYDKSAKGKEGIQLLIEKFVNKNKIYIDIRNEYNRSYNYYQNNEDTINYAINNVNLIPKPLYGSSNWPILTINANDVTNPISDGKINIKFKVNQNPLVCVSQGDTENKQVIYKKTSEIVLNFNTNKDIKPICSYARIKYLNADYYKQNSIFLKKPTPSNFIDAFYFPFKIFNTEQITNDSLSNVFIKTYDDEKFFVNPNFVDETLISNIGIAEDIDNVMFFSYVKMKNGKKIALNFTGNTVKQPTTITEYFENIFDNQRLVKNTIIGSDNKPKQILNFSEYNNEITKSDLNKYFSGILLKKSSIQRIKIALTSTSSISQEMDIFLKINKVDELKDQWIKYSAALYIFDTSYNIVELTTTPPIFLYAKSKPDNDGLILVDEDISIIPLQSDGDELLKCKTPVISGGSETGSIQAFISALESVSETHPPSKKILDNVFKKTDNSGTQINNISVNGSTLTVVDREYLKSNYYWLAEACTVYTMWKYCQLLTEYVNVNGPTNDLVEYIKLKNTIPKSLKNTANRSYIDNGKLVEENFSSTLELNEFWISVLTHNKSQDERIIFLQFNINKDFKDPKTNKYIDTTNRISFTSVKSLPEGSTPTHERILSFLKRLNKTILQFINNEINCLYKYILNDNNVKFPETYIIGVGDGGGTKGVLGDDNVGVLFFNYDYYQPNIGGSILPSHYKIISKLKYPVIHFDLFGFDDNYNKRILIINKNDGNIDEYCLFIADKNIKQFVPHHFTNDRPFDISNSGFDINKEFPTNSLDFTTTGTESVFKNNKGKTLAKYNNSTNNIVFLDHKNNDTYNLILYDYLDSDGKGRNHLDEIHLVVNTLPPFSDNSIIPGINNFNLSIKDLFESDSFKIKDPKKDNLDTELNKQSDAIAELALRISNIPNNQNHFNDLLNIQITPLFIGMEENRTNKIISNPKYYFNRDRNKREIESTDGANLKLRYSGLNVNYSDDNTINIFIESSVDPQRSRLDKFEHWSNISSNDFNNNLLPDLDSFTTFGANNFDPALNDNYIVVDNSKKPSYNALLCCFRSFALLKYVIDNYVKPAMTNNSERGARQILLDNVLNNILIQVNTNIGLAKNVTGEDFSTFNTYAK